MRVPGSSHLVPVNQLSAGFDAGKVSNLVGATIVGGRLRVDEGASKVTYDYATGNGKVPSMPVTWRVMVALGYTVSFDMGAHGSQVATQSVLEGEQASAPAVPSAKGWEFKGWYTDNTSATSFDFAAPINSDVTVYAKWEETPGEPTGEPTTEPTGKSTTTPSGKSTAKPTNAANQVTPEGLPITGANSSWIALLGGGSGYCCQMAASPPSCLSAFKQTWPAAGYQRQATKPPRHAQKKTHNSGISPRNSNFELSFWFDTPVLGSRT